MVNGAMSSKHKGRKSQYAVGRVHTSSFILSRKRDWSIHEQPTLRDLVWAIHNPSLLQADDGAIDGIGRKIMHRIFIVPDHWPFY